MDSTQAMLACVRHAWKLFADDQGMALADVPIKGMFVVVPAE
jgi:hypothetical protein